MQYKDSVANLCFCLKEVSRCDILNFNLQLIAPHNLIMLWNVMNVLWIMVPILGIGMIMILEWPISFYAHSMSIVSMFDQPGKSIKFFLQNFLKNS